MCNTAAQNRRIHHPVVFEIGNILTATEEEAPVFGSFDCAANNGISYAHYSTSGPVTDRQFGLP
jgi:hypothetical protein